MPTSFPTSRDSLTNPTASDPKNSATVPHASQHANANDAIEAIEAALPITSEGSVPRGILPGGYAQTTTLQSGITSEVDLTGLSVTVTAGTSRRLEICGFVRVASTVADDGIEVTIHEGATRLEAAPITVRVANRPEVILVSVFITPSSGSHTYKLRLGRFAGTGSVGTDTSATAPLYIAVRDVGAA